MTASAPALFSIEINPAKVQSDSIVANYTPDLRPAQRCRYRQLDREMDRRNRTADLVFVRDSPRRLAEPTRAPALCKTVLALAVRWVLDRGDTIALWGARCPEQLASVADVLGWSIDSGTVEAMDLILKQTIRDPVGREFMTPPMMNNTRLTEARKGNQQEHKSMYNAKAYSAATAISPLASEWSPPWLLAEICPPPGFE